MSITSFPVEFNYRLVFDPDDESVMSFIITDTGDRDLVALLIEELNVTTAPTPFLKAWGKQRRPTVVVKAIRYNTARNNCGLRYIPKLLEEFLATFNTELILADFSSNPKRPRNFGRFEEGCALLGPAASKVHMELAGFIDSNVEEKVPRKYQWYCCKIGDLKELTKLLKPDLPVSRPREKK